MKQKTIAFLLALTMLLSVCTVTLAEDETTPLILGGGLKSYQIISADELDTTDLTLNQIPYQPQLNSKGDIMLSTSDLLCADEAQRRVNEGNVKPADLVIKHGNIIPASDALITMEDINALIGLLEKYRTSNIPAGSKTILANLLSGFYAARKKKPQDVADQWYLSTLRATIESYSSIFSVPADAGEKQILDKMKDDRELVGLMYKLEQHIDKGIFHDYTPQLDEAFSIQSSGYTLASGGGTMITNLEIIKMFQSPITPENGYRCPGCDNMPCTCNPLPAAVPEVNDNPSSGVDGPRPIG